MLTYSVLHATIDLSDRTGGTQADLEDEKSKIFLLIAFYRVATGYIKSEYDIEGLGKNLFGRVQFDK